MIEATNLTKLFKDKKRGEIRAVDNISFTCRPGEIYGLLGPNGAGKTTTLRMLSTALKPTSGSAVIYGVDVVKEPQRVRSRIGFLSGNTGLYARLSPREMVTY
ncbi:MAG: ATP-binding cassette domain-containing protein, partial [candidate division Zixibacteria bacterium]|nr:ATP-binding cassette domain-containing protein [candidate division Zixibacteria bacterium]